MWIIASAAHWGLCEKQVVEMEKEEDDPPVAVEIDQSAQQSYSHPQSDSKRPQTDDVPVGVTVITGYLGAGKSTVKSLSLTVSTTLAMCAFLFINSSEKKKVYIEHKMFVEISLVLFL